MPHRGGQERYAELFNEDSRSEEQPWMYGFIADMCGSYAYFDTSDAVPVDMMDFPVYEDVTTGIKLHCPTPSTNNSMEILEMPAWEYKVGGMSGTVDGGRVDRGAHGLHGIHGDLLRVVRPRGCATGRDRPSD